MKRCIETGRIGEDRTLDEAGRAETRGILDDPVMLLRRAMFKLFQRQHLESAMATDDPVRAFLGLDGLPTIERYRVSFEMVDASPPDPSVLPLEDRQFVESAIEEDRTKLIKALETGILESTEALDPVRRAWFEQRVDSFDPHEHPSKIPAKFIDGLCNVYGHICPVFFAAEAATETSEERRRGRYISFATKMRVVRRDNHTCQHCGKHLRDDEVEFDHIIPVSKGGSSEEHNLRLTCFDCNRDKSDEVVI
jgi:hypothetical protein